MKEFIQKSISITCLLIFAFIVYREVLAPTARNANGGLRGTNLTLSESTKMHETFGGLKGDLPITIFVTSWCSACRALEAKLKESGIRFAKADVENDRNAFLYYQQVVKGKTSGVPVTVVGQDVFVGYDISNIAKSIKALKNLPKGV